MNMVGMNSAAAGGPVGGMAGMMNNGSPATPSNATGPSDQKEHLNTCIYEYFLKMGYYDIARKLAQEPKFTMRTKPHNIKSSPGRRKDGELNGVDADGMDMDIKDDIPDDLPRPMLGSEGTYGNGFLLDWWSIFSDFFSSARKVSADPSQSAARQYLAQTHNIQRLRESQQNQNMPRSGMVGSQAQFAAMRGGMRNGMTNSDLQKAAQMSKTLTPMQMHQIHAQQRMFAHAQQQNMQREHSDIDMNGRPGSPAEGENGGSPSKRPRLEGQQFNGGMGQNGRVQGMPGAQQQQQMLMQSGFNPNNLSNAQFRQNGAMAQKAMQGQMGNGMMNMANAGSPMLQPMSDPQFANGVPMDMYNQRMPGQPMPGGPVGAQGGNHALQDYQMQLMLLEQQNKKRLMMARQEQDNITSRADAPGMPGQVSMPQGMSPRSGASPNPTEQMKRGAQLGGLPGSPSAGDIQGRSPATGMGFMNNNNLPPDYNPGMFMKPNEGMVGPGPNMRPPTTMDMGAMGAMRNQQGRMPGQFPGGQPMVPQNSQGQPQPMGTPVTRSEMPPPQAPATGNANAGRTQPASPQQNQAPPTPSQSNKANPKKKGKDNSDTRKKPNKKNSTANAPNESEPPATPTPSVPISPQHPNSFNANSAGKNVGPGAAPSAGPTSNPTAMQPTQMQPDLQNSGFSDFGNATDTQFNLDFSTLETGDVLENFDFDSFLNTTGDDGGFNFGGDMDNFALDPSVE